MSLLECDPVLRNKRKVVCLHLSALLVGIAVSASGCRTWHGEPEYHPRRKLFGSRGPTRPATFGIGLPGKGWSPYPERESGVQVAWLSDTTSALIQVRSQCAEHGDSSLEMFTAQIGADFGEWNVVEVDTGKIDRHGRPIKKRIQNEIMLEDRRAVRSTIEATLDGVPMRLEVVVLKKNGCLFDLTYIATPEAFDAGLPAFERVIAGFRYPLKAGDS